MFPAVKKRISELTDVADIVVSLNISLVLDRTIISEYFDVSVVHNFII